MADTGYRGSMNLYKMSNKIFPLLKYPASDDASWFTEQIGNEFAAEAQDIMRVYKRLHVLLDNFHIVTFATSIWKATQFIESMEIHTEQHENHPILSCKYLFVDEVQDISKQQCRLIEALVTQMNPICTMLGDTDQAIFGFSDRTKISSLNNTDNSSS